MSNALFKNLLMHSIRPDNFVRKVKSGTKADRQAQGHELHHICQVKQAVIQFCLSTPLQLRAISVTKMLCKVSDLQLTCSQSPSSPVPSSTRRLS